MVEDAKSGGYQRFPNWIVGFHGCDKSVGRFVLGNEMAHLTSSTNVYDWLGNGIYFWENDPLRALQFARQAVEGKVSKGCVTEPFVIGAIIDLGLCCNLFDQVALQEIALAHGRMRGRFDEAGMPMPRNHGPKLALRNLDRAVIEFMHALRREARVRHYQTVRAAFMEGDALYPGASFRTKNHIQIAVRDSACIRGYFLPRGLSPSQPS